MFLGIFSLITTCLHVQNLTQIKNVFACPKHSNFKNGQSLFFSNIIFSTKFAPFLLKIGKNLTLIIRRAKGLELMMIVFYNHLSTFCSKMFLTLKIMDFENMPLTKVFYVYVIEGIYMI
jgi:hypothetical protein